MVKDIMSLQFYLILSVLFNAAYSIPQPRIVGGNIAPARSEFPYQALILLSQAPVCGGTIIDQRHILTAGHCSVWSGTHTFPVSLLNVVVGNLNLYDNTYIKDVIKVIVHEDYNDETLQNDIALMRISGTFEPWTNIVHPINITTFHILSGYCNVSGWGVTNELSSEASPNLRYAEIPIVNWNDCSEAYADGAVTNTQICAGALGRGACSGDSGGPLVCAGTLVGIISFGVGCAREVPAVFTEVSKFVHWINLQIASSESDKKQSKFLFLLLILNLYKIF